MGEQPPVSKGEWMQHLGGRCALNADAAAELLLGSCDNPPPRVELAVEVDIDTLNPDNNAGRAAVGSQWSSQEVIRRYACDQTIRPVICDSDGHDVSVGSAKRIVPRWLRRRLERRDHHHCQFPSCARTRHLQAHHIIHWADGGPTELDNLVLLCRYHHRLKVGLRRRSS